MNNIHLIFMATYDNNISSSVLNIETKRRTYRIDIQRPIEHGSIVTGYVYMNEDVVNSTPNNSNSGSAIGSTSWRLELTHAQVLARTNAGAFLTDVINFASQLKDEYDSSGTLATGSFIKLK
jgi:hypothetical protein